MGVVATLLKQVPAAAKYGPKLKALENELAQLRAENAGLKEELAQYIEQWETLDGPQVSMLQYLVAQTQGNANAIANTINVNIQIAETSLVFLFKHGYVTTAAAGGKSARGSTYALAPKGERYLRERGLHR